MESIGLADWKRWRREGCTRLPSVLVLRNEPPPQSWEGFSDAPATVLLESAQSGRFSYLCDRPHRVILGQAAGAEVWSADCKILLGRISGKPLDLLRSIFAGVKTPALPGWPAMAGGMMGVFGYDLVHTWEKLPVSARRDRALPLFALIETGDLFIYDHHERTLRIIIWSDVGSTHGDEALAECFRLAEEAAASARARWQDNRTRLRATQSGLKPAETHQAGDGVQAELSPASLSPAQFQAAVRRAQDYIAAGHTYQVNLSRRTSRVARVPAVAIYEALRRVNPSPYMGLLRLPDFALVCGSPELLVKLVDGVVSSRPIAGTRPRGDAVLQDSHFSAELLASEKERAEHLMLVDLIRNDIGRVAAFGSVWVKEFMVLERYSHVMHIVSQVEGRLAAGQTWVEVLRSMFPGGTITGCPKIRTMEIIEELEPVGRGFYTGALGWISYGGEMEMNIVIRSMLVREGIAQVQAGAGIVADSQPERELDEADRKAQALWVALEAAEKRHE